MAGASGTRADARVAGLEEFPPLTLGDLKEAIRFDALVHGDFVLSSGRQASYYVDISRVSLCCDVWRALGHHVRRAMEAGAVRANAVGGPIAGACPLVTAAMQSGAQARQAFFVRDGKKDHGVGEQIVGLPRPGTRVLLVDDVVSTGETLIQSAEACIEHGLIVAGVWCVVDRGKGAGDRLEEIRVPYASLFTMAELGIDG